MSQIRQLAAIMFTDIVGYTALMGSNEQNAFELLKKNLDIQKPIIKEFHGRFIKELGDGVLASFSTVSEALNAAIKIQEACSASKELSLRIGIHEGEIIFENNDIYGDAVNIASRIQTLGVPGSILFSKKVTDEIKNKTEFHAVSLGSFEFKNVNESIEVFALANSGFPVPEKSMLAANQKKKKGQRIKFFAVVLLTVMGLASIFIYKNNISSNEKNEIIDKSIAVLPFVDMSAGKDQEYFSDGLSEELLNRLSKIPGLKVIGRTSSFSFKGKNEDLRIIGSKLGVAHILEGSVQKDGNKIRVTAQMVRTADGSHLWSERYDRNLEGIFKLQDDIAGAVVNQLKLKLFNPKANANVSPVNIELYSLLLQGNYFAEKRDKESLAKALDFYLMALAIDSMNARTWAALGKCYLIQSNWGWIDRNKGLQKASIASNRSLSLDKDQAYGHELSGRLKMWNFDWTGAEAEFRKVLNLQPGNADILRIMGYLYRITGRFDEAIRLTKESITLDPVQSITYFNFGQLLYHANHLEEAISSYKKVLELNPNFPRAHIFLGKVYLLQQKPELALEEMSLETNEAWRTFGLILAHQALGRKKEVDKMLSDYISSFSKDNKFQIAEIYAVQGEKDKAFYWLEEAYIDRESRITYVKADPLLKNLESDPRYTNFLKKMNLPLD